MFVLKRNGSQEAFDLKKIAKGTVFFNIAEVKRPDAEAKLIADQAADEMMAEIEREAALAAFQQKLEDGQMLAPLMLMANGVALINMGRDGEVQPLFDQAQKL